MHPFKRINFFSGRLLTGEDFRAEQEYHHEKRKLHNRYLHGWGIVSGLEVSVSGSTTIQVEPGLALDCEGNEIIVAGKSKFDGPNRTIAGTTLFVGIRYQESKTEPIVVSGDSQSECQFIKEGFELVCQTDNSNRGHRHSKGKWCSCGKAHVITIARLRKTANGWRVDRRYRPPLAK